MDEVDGVGEAMHRLGEGVSGIRVDRLAVVRGFGLEGRRLVSRVSSAVVDLEASGAGLRLEGAVAGDVLLLQHQVDPRDAEVGEPRMPQLRGDRRVVRAEQRVEGF